MRTVTLPDQTEVSALGQGTWRMGEDASRRKQEIAMTLIDTAEMYGDGVTKISLISPTAYFSRLASLHDQTKGAHDDRHWLQRPGQRSDSRGADPFSTKPSSITIPPPFRTSWPTIA